MQRGFDGVEMDRMKYLLKMKRAEDDTMISYREKSGSLGIEMTKYAHTFIDKIYPLLDPDLKNRAERRKQHLTWSDKTLFGNHFEQDFTLKGTI